MSRTSPKGTGPAPTAAREGRRSIKSAERRQRVLAAANRCFSRYGFRKTTVDVIAREAAVSKALVFTFFGDKETLYEAVIQQTSSAWAGFAEYQAALYRDSPGQELASMFRGAFEFASHSPMLRVLMARREREILEKGAGLPPVERAWRTQIAGILRRGVAQGTFRTDLDCRLTSSVIHEVQHFYLEQMLDVEPGKSNSERRELALQLILRAIEPPAGVAPKQSHPSRATRKAARR